MLLTAFIHVMFSEPPPPDIFHDPNTIGIAGVIGTIVAIIVAIGIGIYQVRQSRTQRRLEYTTLSNAPIVSVNTSVADQVEIDIKVKGVPAKDAHLVVLNVKNTGKASIHTADYFEPLTFEFDTKVLSASVLNTTPPTLIKPNEVPTFLTLAPQSIGFPAFPFNPNDTIQMSILLEGTGKMNVRGRLDQGRIIEYDSRKPKSINNIVIVVAAILLIVSAVGVEISSASSPIITIIETMAIISTTIIIISTIVIMRGRISNRNNDIHS